MPPERETLLEADVLIIGAGPGGGWRLCAASRESNRGSIPRPANLPRSPPKIFTCWKRRAKSARISFPVRIMGRARPSRARPDFEKTAPLDTPVTGDAAYYFTGK